MDFRDTPYAETFWTEETRVLRDNRYRHTLNFLPKQLGRCLEVGEKNPFSEALKERAASILNTDFDLDYPYKLATGKRYTNDFDSVCLFEVIEHLMNPLSLLEWCADRIRSNPAGRIFLSTPVCKPKFLRPPNHFHEFTHDELFWLFKRAGLKITREAKTKSVPASWMLKGVRPLLRYLYFNRGFVAELKLDSDASD